MKERKLWKKRDEREKVVAGEDERQKREEG